MDSLTDRSTGIRDAALAHLDRVDKVLATQSLLTNASLWAHVGQELRNSANDLEVQLAKLAADAVARSASSALLSDADRRGLRRRLRGAIAAIRLRGYRYWEEQLHYDEDIYRGKTPEGETEYELRSVAEAKEALETEFEELRRFLLFVDAGHTADPPVSVGYFEGGQDYDAALSFAGADRHTAESLAECLKCHGVRVFYDKYEGADLWGKDLYQHLQTVYRDRAKFCVILVSNAYANKVWTRHELKQAQARAFRENREYILPLRLDDTELPGLNDTIAYVDLRETDVTTVCELLLRKIAGFESESAHVEEESGIGVEDDEPELLDLRVAMDEAFARAMRASSEIGDLFARSTTGHVKRKAEAEAIVAARGRDPRSAHKFASEYAEDLATLASELGTLTKVYRSSTNAFFDNLEELALLHIRNGLSTREDMLQGLDRIGQADAVAKLADQTYADVQSSLLGLQPLTRDFKIKRRRAITAIEDYRASLRHWVSRSEAARQRLLEP